MEVDSGKGGSLVIANHIAPLLGLPADMTTPQEGQFVRIANQTPKRDANDPHRKSFMRRVGYRLFAVCSIDDGTDKFHVWASPSAPGIDHPT
jgi:hypothetical protein